MLSVTVAYWRLPPLQLLGHIDLDTREWTDGVLTFSARQVVKEPPEVTSWITCDGDIDPEWIESLNSVLGREEGYSWWHWVVIKCTQCMCQEGRQVFVCFDWIMFMFTLYLIFHLDDNHLLTMPNGERIQFGSNVNFVFETHDLSCASPATISRMGMLFLRSVHTAADSQKGPVNERALIVVSTCTCPLYGICTDFNVALHIVGRPKLCDALSSLMRAGCYGLLFCAARRMLMSKHLSSSGFRATPPQLSLHLHLNHGLLTTSTPPWSGSCLLGARWWSPLSQAWLWTDWHMYTRHRVRLSLCVGWSEGWVGTWLRGRRWSWPRLC